MTRQVQKDSRSALNDSIIPLHFLSLVRCPTVVGAVGVAAHETKQCLGPTKMHDWGLNYGAGPSGLQPMQQTVE
jgi:hypothetical protein